MRRAQSLGFLAGDCDENRVIGLHLEDVLTRYSATTTTARPCPRQADPSR